jgi:hypothetical protein
LECVMSNVTGPWSKSRIIFLILGIILVAAALWMMTG